jgi:hypothetical protein
MWLAALRTAQHSMFYYSKKFSANGGRCSSAHSRVCVCVCDGAGATGVNWVLCVSAQMSQHKIGTTLEACSQCFLYMYAAFDQLNHMWRGSVADAAAVRIRVCV